MDKDAILRKAYHLAFEYEREYRGCAQCSLAALQDLFDMREDEVFRSASGLSGGVGLSTMGACGALTGGAMAIGMLFGREREEFDDPKGKRKVAYRLCNQLAERFVAEYGSVVCKEIQRNYLGREYDLWDPEEYGDFDDIAYKRERCPELVGQATMWACEIILDNLHLLEGD